MTDKKEFIKEILFLAGIGIFIFLWAVIQPYGASPDESMRYDISQYIYQNHSLTPHGADPAIRNAFWGYSYAFFPILYAILGALFMSVTSMFSTDAFHLLMAARMVSILCGIGMAWFVMRIGEKVWGKGKYKWLFTCMVTLVPQCIFLFSYVNNDSLALFATAMILYAWICGMESRWNYKSCIILAAGIILCAMSYYNAYGIILASVLFFLGCIIRPGGKDRNLRKDLIKKGVLISVIVLAGISWWFIRNYFLYDGDFLGLTTSEYYSELYGLDEVKPSNRETPYNLNYSLWYMLFGQDWLRITAQSFFGCFGYMSIPLKMWMYIIYASLLVAGMVGLFYRKKRNSYPTFREEGVSYPSFPENGSTFPLFLFHGAMLLAILIPNILNVIHSYLIDFQPQGRYSMSMIVPLMYFVVQGWQKICRNTVIIRLVIVTFVIGAIGTYIFIFAPNYLGA